jgi:1,3-beta-glucanosyltransferase GAS1
MLSVCSFLSLLFAASSAGAISPLSIKGTKFFNAQGEQIFFKGIIISIRPNLNFSGIDYQRSPYDPFVNETQCQLDAQLMTTLGANAIRCMLFRRLILNS